MRQGDEARDRRDVHDLRRWRQVPRDLRSLSCAPERPLACAGWLAAVGSSGGSRAGVTSRWPEREEKEQPRHAHARLSGGPRPEGFPMRRTVITSLALLAALAAVPTRAQTLKI